MEVCATVSCPVRESFRVAQVRGMFDLSAEATATTTVSATVPGPDEPFDGKPWQIGLIVGPSGSGKSTIARRAFGDRLAGPFSWASDSAVIDGFDMPGQKRDIRAITQTLAAVGFSSPPAWLRPYHVLSNGEKFRCDLARALLGGGQTVVFDEFTSVVDRVVARIGSAAVAKAARGGSIARQFVAVSCHYDIAEWLCPDWIVDMATGRLARGSLCRPGIGLEVRRVGPEPWKMFKRHHYLSARLPAGAACYVATAKLAAEPPVPVAFAAVNAVMGFAGYRRISRLVVLPDWQGIGVGAAFRDIVAGLTAGRAGVSRVSITTSHPAMINSLKRCARWKCAAVEKMGFASDRGKRTSQGRGVCTFLWRPPAGGAGVEKDTWR